MEYLRLFRLELRHPYYQNGLCSDFDVLPTASTETALKRQRMRVKNFGYGIEITAQASNATTQFIPLGSNLELQFTLHLRNADFVLNSTVADLPALTADDVQNQRQYYRQYSNENLLAAATGLESIDLLASREQSIELGRAWGVLTIQVNDVLKATLGTPPTYTVDFSGRTATWKYYLLTDPTSANFQVQDDGTEPISFSKIDVGAEALPDNLTQRLLDTYPDADMWRFESTAPVTYTQLGRKDVNLRKDGALVIEHLPVPTANDRGIQIIKTFL